MKLVIETFITIFFITAIVFVSTQMLGAQIQVNAAEEFQNNIVKKIEESNFDDGVIASCVLQAEQEGYGLEVDVNKVDMLWCNSCNTKWELDNRVVCPTCGGSKIGITRVYHDGCVVLTYQVSAALFGFEQTGRIVSYAR